MKFPIFASFIVFCLFTTFTIKKRTSDHQKKEEEFWENERIANATRKKSLDNLKFIHLPFDHFASPVLEDKFKDEYEEILSVLKELDKDGIVNLSGLTNTDLKLQYGVANLDILTHYDQNYTDTLIGLDKIGTLLFDAGLFEAALTYLEYAVSIHTDISTTYEHLAKIYHEQGNDHKLQNLIPIANELKSLQKEKILHLLQPEG